MFNRLEFKNKYLPTHLLRAIFFCVKNWPKGSNNPGKRPLLFLFIDPSKRHPYES